MHIRVAVLGLMLVGCDTGTVNTDKSAFGHLSHLADDGLPALAAFYRDVGNFPSGDIGWKGLTSNTNTMGTQGGWRGPYLSPQTFSPHESGMRLNLLDGYALYSCSGDGQVATITLVGHRAGRADFTRTVFLVEASHVKRCKLSTWQQSVVAKMDALVLATTDYYRANSKYPGNVDALRKQGKEVASTLNSLQMISAMDYSGQVASNRFVFVFRKTAIANSDFDLFSKAGECEILAVDSKGKSVFIAFGDTEPESR